MRFDRTVRISDHFLPKLERKKNTREKAPRPPFCSLGCINDSMEVWWIVEFSLRDLDLPHPLLISLIHSLPFPANPEPPPHIRRLFLLRHLLSASASHRLLSPLTLKTLERLLPPPTSPPSPSLCTAYSSHLFYLSMHPGFSLDVAAVLSRLSNYCFAMKLLEPWRGMIARQEKIRSFPGDRVVSARDKAIFALRDFVDEEIRAMEPPFILRGVQELCTGYFKFAELVLTYVKAFVNCQLYISLVSKSCMSGWDWLF